MKYNAKNYDNLVEILNICNENDEIYLEKGIFQGKLKITKNNIKIIGSGKDTILSNKDYYNKIGNDNKELLTVRTYTLLIKGNNVTLENLTVRNESVPNSIYGQAVALEVLGDNFICNNVNLIGAQDTLLAGPIPSDLIIRYKDLLPQDELVSNKSHQLYNNCYIEGDVDFIFGSAIAYFNSCTLHSIGKGYIAAPSHSKDYKYGFIFNNCLIESNEGLENCVELARPWRDYGYASFIDCKIKGNHIKQSLFNNWVKGRENTCRFSIYNTTSTSNMAKFAKELTKDEAKSITKEVVLNS